MITPEEMELFSEHYHVVEKANHVIEYSYITDGSLAAFAGNKQPEMPFEFDKDYEDYGMTTENVGTTSYLIMEYASSDAISEHFDTAELKTEIQSLINDLMKDITAYHKEGK